LAAWYMNRKPAGEGEGRGRGSILCMAALIHAVGMVLADPKVTGKVLKIH
jgi:hypothetical protein